MQEVLDINEIINTSKKLQGFFSSHSKLNLTITQLREINNIIYNNGNN